jgi:hypothetical protein
MGGTGSGSCSVVSFRISDVEASGSTTGEVVAYVVSLCHPKQILGCVATISFRVLPNFFIHSHIPI